MINKEYFEYSRQVAISSLPVPKKEAYKVVAVFEDLYGNRCILLQPAALPHP